MFGRVDAAKEVNRHVLDAGAAFGAEVLPFVCECGCLEQILMTAQEYVERGGAVVDGHEAGRVVAMRHRS